MLTLNRPAILESDEQRIDAEYRSANWVHHRLLDFEQEHQKVLDATANEIAPGIIRAGRIVAKLARRAKRAERTTEGRWAPNPRGDLCARLRLRLGELREKRKSLKVVETYDAVPVSGVENAAYYYSTYNALDKVSTSKRRKVMILGGGPNRIGQGIEFDYCCVHAAFALRDLGYETIMVNCNPETVSTDYDTSDKLYFEPLTVEDVLSIYEKEKPEGVIVQFGGQTPLNIAAELEQAGVKILGTTPETIDLAEDRDRFRLVMRKLGIPQPDSGMAKSFAEALQIARQIGYPLMVRPSYVLGGRAMEIVYDESDLKRYMKEAVKVSPDHPILIDRFLQDAVEVDVDCVADGETAVIGGIMEHIEEAGIHSGDSACSLPPYSLEWDIVKRIARQTREMALELGVKGLMNVQYAVKDWEVYVLEVNPRASRTVPFVSKAIGRPLAKIAAMVMVGKSLKELGFTEQPIPEHISVKESVFPFTKFPNVDVILGPEMKSTGEVMGIDYEFPAAYAKSQLGAGMKLPTSGVAFLSVKDHDKPLVVKLAGMLLRQGFEVISTRGTAQFLNQAGLKAVRPINKYSEGSPHVVDLIQQGGVQLVINTTQGKKDIRDSFWIRRSTLLRGIPYYTTIPGAYAGVRAIGWLKEQELGVKPLQDYHQKRPNQMKLL